MKIGICSCVAVVLLISGCGSSKIQPPLIPNMHYRDAGEAQVQKDVDECNGLADQYGKQPDRYTDMARQAGTGVIIGSAAGALGGVIMGGNVGRSVGAGAAIGAIVPLIQMLLTSNDDTPSRTTFVEACLTNRGYEVGVR